MYRVAWRVIAEMAEYSARSHLSCSTQGLEIIFRPYCKAKRPDRQAIGMRRNLNPQRNSLADLSQSQSHATPSCTLPIF